MPHTDTRNDSQRALDIIGTAASALEHRPVEPWSPGAVAELRSAADLLREMVPDGPLPTEDHILARLIMRAGRLQGFKELCASAAMGERGGVAVPAFVMDEERHLISAACRQWLASVDG